MTVIEWQQFLDKGLPEEILKTSVTVGVFDGVHLGHRALLERIVSYNNSYVPVVFTFRSGSIQTFGEKIAVLESLGVKITVVIDFTESFKRMTGIHFLEILYRQCNTGYLSVGNNFKCGYQLDTDAEVIREFFSLRNIPVEIIPEVLEGGMPISSSRIRSAILAGDINLVEVMLGRSYAL